MIVQSLAFYVTSAILVASAVMVISARNPVHSVLFLILAFFQAAGLFVLLGAEFLAMLLVIVYVGAVAVLFLFVVMMLNINFATLRQGFLSYLPMGMAIGAILLAELSAVLGGWVKSPAPVSMVGAPMPPASEITNTVALGQVLYTQYFYLFQAAGMVLLIAMIGAIVLTHRVREGVRRQNIAAQVSRRREDTVVIRKVPTRGGI